MPRYVYGTLHRGWVLLLLALAQPTVAQTDSLFRLSPARRYAAVASVYRLVMVTDTLAGKRLRRQLEAFFRKNGTETDRFHLEVALLEIEQHCRLHPETLLPRALALLARAEARRDTVMLAKSHLNAGEIYFHLQKDYYPAFRHFGQAFDLLRRLPDDAFPDRAAAVYKLARASYDFLDYEKAIEVGRAIHRWQPAGPLNPSHAFNACMLGMAFFHRRQLDSARAYFEWGLRRLPFEGLDNDAWVGIFSGDLGRVLAAQGQREAAVLNLKKGIDYTTRTRLWDNVAPFGACLARLYLETGQTGPAGHYARLAHAAARRDGSAEWLHETHQTLAAYHRRTSRADLALAHADSATAASDRWRAETDVTLKHRAEMTLEAERHEAREVALQREKDRQVLVRNGLIGFLLLGAVIAWLLHNRQRVAARHRHEQARAAQARSDTELRQARAQLDQYLQHLCEKNDLIERLSGKLTEVADPAAQTARHDRIATLLDSVILTEADWQRFRQVFEQVYPGFFERLRTTHPDLTPAEVRLLALSKLSILPTDMGLMLGVSTESLRKARYRLRRKLEHLGAEEALLGLIRPI